MKDKETTMGQLLIESLTTDQMACMLEVVASAGNLKSLMDDFMRADPDMAATVDEILKGVQTKADGKTNSRPVSPILSRSTCADRNPRSTVSRR